VEGRGSICKTTQERLAVAHEGQSETSNSEFATRPVSRDQPRANSPHPKRNEPPTLAPTDGDRLAGKTIVEGSSNNLRAGAHSLPGMSAMYPRVRADWIGSSSPPRRAASLRHAMVRLR